MENDQIRKVLTLLPLPLVLITTSYKEKRAGMTAAWVTQVSWEPAYVAVAIYYEGHTLKIIRKSREFAIHIISEDLSEAAVKVFGSLSSKNMDKFEKAKVTVLPSQKVRVPIIKEALAILECKVVKILKIGDHCLVIGQPIFAHIIHDVSDRKPILWWKGIHKMSD